MTIPRDEIVGLPVVNADGDRVGEVDDVVLDGTTGDPVVIVGVGDGPFNEMDQLDDGLPERRFDNCQFVDWTVFDDAIRRGEDPEVVRAAFAVCALQEVPHQFRTAVDLGLLLDGATVCPLPRAAEADAPPAKRARVAGPAA